MTLLDKVKKLCDDHGETLASLERKMDFGNGTIRRWEATIPSGDRLAKVADYFHVSVDYLLGRESLVQPPVLKNAYFSFAKNAQDSGIDPEDIQAVLEIMKRAKEKRDDKNS